jgi:hypothetical protein
MDEFVHHKYSGGFRIVEYIAQGGICDCYSIQRNVLASALQDGEDARDQIYRASGEDAHSLARSDAMST